MSCQSIIISTLRDRRKYTHRQIGYSLLFWYMGLHEQNHQTPDSTVRAKPIEYFLLVSNYLSDTLIWLHVPAHILCENWKNQCIRNIARVFWCKCKQWTKTNNKGKIGILVPQLYPEGQVRHSTFKLAYIVPQLFFLRSNSSLCWYYALQ